MAENNLFQSFQDVNNKTQIPNSQLLVPLMKWFSNTPKNISRMQVINKYFFYADKDVLMRTLYFNVARQPFIKYPKKEKEKEDKLQFLYDSVMKYYGWSEREFDKNKHFIDFNDPELRLLMHRKYAFDEKQCKLLNIEYKKLKVKFEEKKKPAGLAGFF